MEILVLVVVILVVSAVANIWWTVSAKRTASIGTVVGSDEVRQIVEKCFSKATWKTVGGPAAVNRKLRVPFLEGPTVSVDIEETPDGARVDAWTSAWHSRLGVMDVALAAVLKKRKVMNALADSAPQISALPVSEQQSVTDSTSPAASPASSVAGSDESHGDAGGPQSGEVRFSVSSHGESGSLLDEIGALQQGISEGRQSAVGAVGEIVPRAEAVVEYNLRVADDPAQVFDVLVAPLAEWGMHQYATHPDFVNDPQSQEAQARLELMSAIGDFRSKYQYLNPNNT